MIYEINDSDIHLSRAKQKNLNLFWMGLILYTLSYSLAATLVYIKITQLQALQFIGVAMFVYAAINLLKFKIQNAYLKAVYIMLCLWSVGVMMRGITFDFAYLKELIFDAGGGIFIYLVPLFLLFPQNFAFYRKLFWVLLVFSVFHLLFTMIFYKDIFNPDRKSGLSQSIVENFTGMGFSISFLLLTYLYHEPKKRIFALGMLALSLLCVVYRARRGWIFIHVTTLLSILMIYLIVSKKTVMVIYLAVIMGLGGYFYFTSLYNQSNFGVFNFLVERGNEDTRTGVEVLFYEDMRPMDWAIGRGIRGEYYCPNIDALDLRGYRTFIETGYLQIILKGGIISLVLLLLIVIPAFILGLFKSNNIFSKAFGMWILLWVIYLYPTVGNSFSMQYIIVWIGVGVCFSPKIRNLSDEQVAEYLNPPKKTIIRGGKAKIIHTV